MRALLLLLMLASPAFGATKFACDPVFLANPQGRPLANASVSIINTDGTAIASGVWTNKAGTIAFGGTMPTNQLLQVYIEPGAYQVGVTGEGLSKSYLIRCGEGVGTGATVMAIDRTADALLPGIVAPVLGCEMPYPCRLDFAHDVEETMYFDFILPSYPVTFRSMLLSWKSGLLVGTVVWKLDWCAYGVGDLTCTPDGTNAVLVTSTNTSANKRTDVSVTTTTWPVTWASSDHVVVTITRSMTGNTLNTAAMLENVRVELTKG